MTIETFQEKLSTLNKCFVDKITEEFSKTPHADFTPCLLDYIKHLGGIDDECCDHNAKTNGTLSPKLPVLKTTENPLLPTIAPKLPPPEPAKSIRPGGKMKRKASSSIDDDMNSNGSKKSDKNDTFAIPAAPKLLKPFESKATLFGSNNESLDSSKPVSTFSFGSTESKTTSTGLFATPSTLTDDKNKNTIKDNSLNLFGNSNSKNIFKKPDEFSDEKSTGKTSFPSIFGSSDGLKSTFSFMPTSVVQEKDGSSTTKSTLPTFSFQPPPVTVEKKDEGENKFEEEKDEEDEPQEKYDPLQADKDALYTVKCSLHQLCEKQYIKKGVAFINVKELDGKKILVVRAINAVGSILINTHINDNFKVTKLEETKIRMLFPNSDGSGMETWIARLPGANDIEEALKHLKS